MLSAKQKKALLSPCPVCSSKTKEVGDLADFKHDIVICSNEFCQYALMYNGTRIDLE